jgi:hypothetical protein
MPKTSAMYVLSTSVVDRRRACRRYTSTPGRLQFWELQARESVQVALRHT